MQNGGPLQNLYELTIRPRERKKCWPLVSHSLTLVPPKLRTQRVAETLIPNTVPLDTILNESWSLNLELLLRFQLSSYPAPPTTQCTCCLSYFKPVPALQRQTVLQCVGGQRVFSLLKQLFQHYGLIISYVSTQAQFIRQLSMVHSVCSVTYRPATCSNVLHVCIVHQW